jgi:hypothetical protein
MRALRDLWAPTPDTTIKDTSWLQAAAEATTLSAETLSTDDVNGESVICEENELIKELQDVDLDFPRNALRTRPPLRTTAWWEEITVTQTVAPLIKHAAVVTGWEAVSTLSKESGDATVVATSLQTNADLLALSSISALSPASHELGSQTSWLRVSTNPDTRIAVR